MKTIYGERKDITRFVVVKSGSCMMVGKCYALGQQFGLISPLFGSSYFLSEWKRACGGSLED